MSSLSLSHTHTHTHTVYHMKETGWVKISADNVFPLHYKYQEEKAAQRAMDTSA
jgi:hypothetical protein